MNYHGCFKPSNGLTFHTVQADINRLRLYLQDERMTSVQIDLSQVNQCDTAGLALLIEAKKLCRQYNKSFLINQMSKEIEALANFCGVQGILF